MITTTHFFLNYCNEEVMDRLKLRNNNCMDVIMITIIRDTTIANNSGLYFSRIAPLMPQPFVFFWVKL